VTGLRRERGLTQVQLATACGARQSTIGDIEQATVNATLATLDVLTMGLECTLVDLFTPIPPSAGPPEA
jgi:transcriptional regulator with XRE-family HTH domain